MEIQKKIRCAIYTRKSTDEGLEKEFTTLEAQREAGENYIKSFKHQGWEAIMLTYSKKEKVDIFTSQIEKSTNTTEKN